MIRDRSMTPNNLPRRGTASLRSYKDGRQYVALTYDLSRRGSRQAIIAYYEHELSRGREAVINIEMARPELKDAI